VVRSQSDREWGLGTSNASANFGVWLEGDLRRVRLLATYHVYARTMTMGS